jgi:uncharacterized protein with FMN-binding domain
MPVLVTPEVPVRKLVLSALSAYTFLVPVAAGVAAGRSAAGDASSRIATTTVTRKFVGQSALAGQWGSVQVNVTRRTTISGKTARSKYSDLGGQYSYHTSRSQYIMSQALPLLRQEFLTAQGPNIQMISGATLTSQAFEASLQSALLKARK